MSKTKDKPRKRAKGDAQVALSPQQQRDTFISIIAENGTFNDVARALGVHRTTPLRWLREDETGELRNRYAHAREDQGDICVDDIAEIRRKVISGEVPPDVARVAIDSLKWEAGKRRPKVYGDKLELSGDEKSPITVKLITHFPEEAK